MEPASNKVPVVAVLREQLVMAGQAVQAQTSVMPRRAAAAVVPTEAVLEHRGQVVALAALVQTVAALEEPGQQIQAGQVVPEQNGTRHMDPAAAAAA